MPLPVLRGDARGLTADPPRHTRYRATIAGAFGARRIAQLRPVVEGVVHRLVDGWVDDGQVEIVRRFAVPVPVEVIAAVLDISTDHLDDFKRWSDDSVATHPDQWAALRADPDGRAPVLAEEVLRLASPTQGMFRVVTRDVELGGVAVPAGSRLVVLFAAANRDPAVFADPNRFDPDRSNVRDHVAFGKGIHFCLGAPLARLELQVALAGLATRLGSLSLAEGAPLDYRPSFVLRGLERLDIGFTASEHQQAATSGAAGGVDLR